MGRELRLPRFGFFPPASLSDSRLRPQRAEKAPVFATHALRLKARPVCFGERLLVWLVIVRRNLRSDSIEPCTPALRPQSPLALARHQQRVVLSASLLPHRRCRVVTHDDASRVTHQRDELVASVESITFPGCVFEPLELLAVLATAADNQFEHHAVSEFGHCCAAFL